MITSFRTLFTVQVSHSYYSGTCRDFEFIVPPDTAQLLRNGRLLTKNLDGIQYVIFEADENAAPIVPIDGRTLRLGLKLVNPYFTNFSIVDPDFGSKLCVYRNIPIHNLIRFPVYMAHVGNFFTHTLAVTDRPLAVSLLDQGGHAVLVENITDPDRTTIAFDLRGLPSGGYSVQEHAGLVTQTTSYYSDAELLSAGATIVVEITIYSSLYGTPPAFGIDFDAKEEVLKYYVVANNYGDTDFALLSITDMGFTEDGRDEVTFDAVNPDDFTADELSPSLLTGDGDKLILFKSQEALGRREHGPKKIQLSRNGDVLIAQLPQPGADKANADMIIHISKP
ncbi:MAG TPA: hypothetical protein VHI13_22610 [Candidatus Kapabacteria bacterium]|nr:hypothetical protein [Candidatus Kapabacteria bacterium]